MVSRHESFQNFNTKKDLLKLKQDMKSCHNSLQLFKSKNLFSKFKAKKIETGIES